MIITAIIIGIIFAAVVLYVTANLEAMLRRFDEEREGE